MAFAAAAVPYIMAASAAVAVVSAVQQGKAAKAASDYNARLAEQNAQMEREQTTLAMAQADREGRLRLGAIRAAHGAGGGAAGEGSVLDVLGDVAGQNELEKQDIARRGAARAAGFEGTANLERMSGKQAVTGGYLKAGQALLSGAVGTYDAYARVNAPKVPARTG